LHGRMHRERNAVRVRRRRGPDMHDAVERLHAVDERNELRDPSDVYGRGQRLGVHVRLVGLHGGGHHLPGWANTRDVLGRRR
jgi:hypothetical protein